MRKALLSLAFFLVAYLSMIAQNNVGIGISTPHSSARLDITATDKGLLIPRVALVSVGSSSPIVNPAEGLLVWNTNVAFSSGVGFNYWTGTQWRSLLNNNSGWGLQGNTGTTSADFIGTADNSVFRIKVNNNQAGFIDHLNRSTFFGYYAGFNNVNPAADGNTFIGSYAGENNTTGSSNSFLGTNAGQYNQDGSFNSLFGVFAGVNLETGDGNSYFGYASGQVNPDGSNNSYFGRSAGGSAFSGSKNSFFGDRSGGAGGTSNSGLGDSSGYSMQSSAADNTFLGYRTTNQGISFNATAIGARARINCSNCMILGSVNGINGATSSVNVGIGLISPVRPLHISGTPTTTGVTPHVDAVIVAEKSGDNTYISILTDDDRGSGITFGNQLHNIDGGIYYNLSGNSYDLRFRTNRNGTRMLIDSIGRVGIGTTTPDFQLELSQNSAAKPTSSTWTVASDLRLKENVHSFQDGLSILQKINPVWFTYNGEAGLPKETGIGTIAQELKEIAPYMIKEFKRNGNSYLGVDYGPMQFILINAIKEQQFQIESLQKEVDEYKALVNELIKELKGPKQ